MSFPFGENQYYNYNEKTDVLTIYLLEEDVLYTNEEEIAPGIHILHEYRNGRNTGRIASIVIEYYLEEYSS